MTNLNEEQQRAVSSIYGPVLVLAGPGSGKTHTLTKRIQYMIEHEGILPGEILVITFSKKAAEEMQLRFEKLTKDKSYRVYFGTFHAIFYSILRTHTNFNKNSILTEKQKMSYLKRVAFKNNIEIKEEAELIELIDIICAYKNADDKEQFIDERIEEEKRGEFRHILKEYFNICRDENKLDFDDMLTMCRDLLVSKPDICRKYQETYKYILVDEFQDINSVQYEVLDLLAGENANIFAVGDDDQSIYGFRGSKPELMKEFMNRENCTLIDMSRNYRSSEVVVNSAHKLIVNNINRINKKQIPSKQNLVGKFIIENCVNAEKEAEYVCNRIKDIRGKGGPQESIAVIYRTTRCIELLKEKMDSEGILYTSNVLIDNYYEREWIRDIVAYLKAASGNKSMDVIGRILNKPERGLERDVISLHKTEGSMQLNYECIKKYDRLILDLEKISIMSPFAAVNYILKGIGYEQYLYSYYLRRGYETEKVSELIKELMEKSKTYDNIKAWLRYIESSNEVNPENIDDSERINMLTAHSSKGLEFDTVFVVGLQEGIFPHNRALTEEQIEEERRLLYVAMTRAKKDLYVVGRGEIKYGKKISRFINELL